MDNSLKSKLREKLFIIDNCVLEDYLKVDPSLFQLIAEFVGKIHAITAVIHESNEIKKIDYNLGLTLVETEFEDALKATDLHRSISFPDALTLLTAKRHGFTVITNDKRLRTKCAENNVSTVWGLELIVELNHNGGIPKSRAEEIGRIIRSNNLKHITLEILEKFLALIKISL